MIVPTNQHPKNAIPIYLRRWEVECLLSALKGCRFRFEETHITTLERVVPLDFVGPIKSANGKLIRKKQLDSISIVIATDLRIVFFVMALIGFDSSSLIPIKNHLNL
ncbi:transposase [Legionella cherrii]|uniref:Transposase n=1 Tax=Legionella cherrii TaxID=28084 RepID=A0ABY6T7E9_9GAMM|nr:hypothetical protein [Legionella cherrii]VEB37557.1 transposase [Legionella cherrii]